MSLASCSPIASGNGFLRASLAYLDCAGKEVGTAGYTTLSQPESPISKLILALITLFIAWHGIRMMFGRMPDMGEVVIAIAKIGLVLMLVTSWPAVRTLFAAPAFEGPSELVAATRVEGTITLEDRLQRADDGIVTLTKWGTGKLDIRAGQTVDGKPAATEFSGVALTDNLALGLGRLCFLVGALMSIGLLKLLTGVMISALPLFASLLLFETTRGLFLGWARILFAMFVASFAVPLVLTAQLSLIEPWLAQAIEARSAYFATPAAPTELFAITLSFFLILAAAIALLVKACFSVDVASYVARVGSWRHAEANEQSQHHSISQTSAANRNAEPSRAENLSWTLSRMNSPPTLISGGGAAGQWPAANDPNNYQGGEGTAGSIRRRAKQRMALSHVRRNQS